MADIDWSNIPRLVVSLDPFATVLFVGYIGEDNGAMVVVPWNDYYTGLFDGDLLVDSDAYQFVYLVLSLDPFAVLESGTPGYPGLANGTEVIPHPFELPPIAEGVLTDASLVFIPFHCDDTPPEYWG